MPDFILRQTALRVHSANSLLRRRGTDRFKMRKQIRTRMYLAEVIHVTANAQTKAYTVNVEVSP